MPRLTPELIRELDLPQFEDAETARRYLESQAWPDGPVCSHCGEMERVGLMKGYSSRPGAYFCASCRGQFTVTVKTVFQRTKVPLHKWLQITAALEKTPATIDEIKDAIGVSYVTAFRLRGIIRPDIKYGKATGRREALCYPFVPAIQKPRPEHELLMAINAAVPREIPEDRRADICQELAIAVLIGDVDVANLNTAWRPLFHKIYEMHPTKFGPLSLDMALPGTEDFRLIDTLSEEDSLWAKMDVLAR